MMFAKGQRRCKITSLILTFALIAAAAITLRSIYVKHQLAMLMADYDDPDNTTNTTVIASVIMKFRDEIDKSLKILNFIKRANKEQIMHNDLLSGLTENPSSFIVVLVNDDYQRFYQLLLSLSKVVAITRSVIIFSHVCFNDQINGMIWSIQFARYVQIFYPYSLQLIPNSFPGDDHKFCRDGYYCVEDNSTRNARDTIEKHFWWWTVNFVFENLRDLKYNPYHYLFLKSDQLVAEDLIYLFDRMLNLMNSECPQCEILNLGARRPDPRQFHLRNANFFIETFGSVEFNYAIAFNRSLWHKIKERRQEFCYFNDNRWDESLKYVASRTTQGFIESMSPEGPRVLTTACDEKEHCNVTEKLQKASEFYKLILRGLFPLLLNVIDGNLKVNITPKGKWEDVRDKELCMYFTEKSLAELSI